jgi:hypothetical protein
VWWNSPATICSIQSRSSEIGAYLAAAPLDGDGVLETIVRFNDTADDWATLQRLVAALERNAIRSLHPRPLEVGYGPGFDNWIIA